MCVLTASRTDGSRAYSLTHMSLSLHTHPTEVMAALETREVRNQPTLRGRIGSSARFQQLWKGGVGRRRSSGDLPYHSASWSNNCKSSPSTEDGYEIMNGREIRPECTHASSSKCQPVLLLLLRSLPCPQWKRHHKSHILM